MIFDLMLTVILLPFAGGVLLQFLRFRDKGQKQRYIFAYVLLNTLLTYVLLWQGPTELIRVINFAGAKLDFSLKLDGLGIVFAGLVSTLWPLAVLYSFPYMEHEHNGRVHENIFYLFYTATYGVTLGIAMSGNMLTMYCFYELLTLVTVPLVMHTLTKEAVLASRKYFYYSLGGAAFSFIGLIFLVVYGDSLAFLYGGVLNLSQVGDKKDLLLFIYVLAFMGFGVKAAVCPFNSWLPQAGVAPTPVTALLHAVAVVKSGAFAIIRLTYYSFGTDFLRGTWAQYLLLGIVIFTIVYGCSMAVRETHIKRRLAFSTVSNLSYILFGVLIMTPLGLAGALCHMVFHGVMKICSFFCAGAMITQAHADYVHQIDGMAKKMPKIFAIFTVSALALMGVPGLCGFVSKWHLAKAAFASDNVLAVVGVGGLLVSALLTAIYMLSIVIRAYFPGNDFDYGKLHGEICDPDWRMLLPLSLFVVLMVVIGVYSAPFVAFFSSVASGMI
ncbi:MAG: proton-conducting membrane transporter [Lachnospiraceae bacterium]|nr:proton-conducting membrane transporter [Lachnospiraceae bacterium]MDE6999775.1 proton-conducting membrane transporter [Lachnospiraceae bacterium]